MSCTYLRRSLAIETNDNPSHLLVAMCDIEVDLVSDLRTLCCFDSLAEVEEGEGANEHQAHEEPLEVRHGEQAHSMYRGSQFTEKKGRW